MNFSRAWYGSVLGGAGVITPAERHFFPADSRGGSMNRTSVSSQRLRPAGAHAAHRDHRHQAEP